MSVLFFAEPADCHEKASNLLVYEYQEWKF